MENAFENAFENPAAALALARVLVQEKQDELRAAGDETSFDVLETSTDDGLPCLELCDADDGGSCAWATFLVVQNKKPNGPASFAVLETNPDNGETWLHLSGGVRFETSLYCD